MKLCPIHRFTRWILEATASQRYPYRIRSCRKCGKTQKAKI